MGTPAGTDMRQEASSDVWFGYLGETLALVCGASTFEEALEAARETLLEMIDCPVPLGDGVRDRWKVAYGRWEEKR